MQIFKSNEFFCGLSIPDPGTVDPLEGKLARGPAGSEGVDFMKVIILLLLIFQLVIYFKIMKFYPIMQFCKKYFEL